MYEKRMTIGAMDCDALGHMNMSRYFAACNAAGFEMQNSIGWPAGATRDGRRLSFAVVHLESDFLAEVLEGQVITVAVGVAEVGRSSAVFVYTITAEDGTPVFTARWKSVLMDLDTRKSAPIPEDLKAALPLIPDRLS